jgi:hypothetical protein
MRRRFLFAAPVLACVTLTTVTVTIDPPARGHVVIDNPYAPHGVTAATYRPCRNVGGFYAQGFAFTDGRIRGCVPLEVRVAGQARVLRVTLSLFAGRCATDERRARPVRY